MEKIVEAIIAAPLPTVFIIAGMIFLLIAVVGNVSGKIEPGAKGRMLSGVLGVAFTIGGLAMYLMQKPPDNPVVAESVVVEKEREQAIEALQRA